MAGRFSGDMVIPEIKADFLSPSHVAKESVDVEENFENVMMHSEKCDSVYPREKDFIKHSKACNGLRSKTVKERACTMALQMIGTSEAPVCTSNVLHPAILNTEITNGTKNKFTRRKGWVQRPLHIKTLGHSTIHLFAQDFQALFEAGNLEMDGR